MDQQQLTRKQAMGGLIVGLIIGIVPGILLYYGGKIFPGTGGPGVPPDPNYGTKTAQSRSYSIRLRAGVQIVDRQVVVLSPPEARRG